MSIELPGPIARYFAADKGSDAASLAACFTPDGTVIDEGNIYAVSNGVQKGPPIGVEEGPPFQII